MHAEDMKTGARVSDGQFGPDGQEPLCLAQEPAGPGIESVPGDIAAQVECQAVAQAARGRTSSSIAFAGGRLRRKNISDWA